MGERRENSVLFSLSELRRIEDQRVQQEETEKQARAAAEVAARQDAERRALQEEEARRRQGEEMAMRERLERERMGREDQLRLDEVERRARVEADAKLRERQMHLEIAAKKPPVKLIVTGAVILLAAVSGLGYYLHQQNQRVEAERVQQARILAQKEAEQRRLQADYDRQRQELSKLKSNIDSLEDKLKSASSDAERAEIKRKIHVARQQLASRANTTPSAIDTPKVRIDTNRDNDPLGGIH